MICPWLMFDTPKCRTFPEAFNRWIALATSSGSTKASGRCSSRISRYSVPSRSKMPSTLFKICRSEKSNRCGLVPSAKRMPHLDWYRFHIHFHESSSRYLCNLHDEANSWIRQSYYTKLGREAPNPLRQRVNSASLPSRFQSRWKERCKYGCCRLPK